MRKLSMMIALSILFGPLAHGQSLVPATSEDLGDFDRQIQEAQATRRQDATAQQKASGSNKKEEPASPNSKNSKSNFGSLVSQEAKKLKDADKSQRTGMGQWVKEQRRQSEIKNPAESQIPAARENSSNAPSQSGKKKK